MSEKEVILTLEGLKKFENEFVLYKTVKRREVVERIKQSLDFGDIRENSEYDDAKNEQALIEGRILTLERMLRNARVIEYINGTDVVSLGSKVRLKDVDFGDEEEYFLVGSAEADPNTNKISNKSPIGKAVLGQTKGTIVNVDTPAGVLHFQILNISSATSHLSACT